MTFAHIFRESGLAYFASLHNAGKLDEIERTLAALPATVPISEVEAPVRDMILGDWNKQLHTVMTVRGTDTAQDIASRVIPQIRGQVLEGLLHEATTFSSKRNYSVFSIILAVGGFVVAGGAVISGFSVSEVVAILEVALKMANAAQ